MNTVGKSTNNSAVSEVPRPERRSVKRPIQWNRDREARPKQPMLNSAKQNKNNGEQPGTLETAPPPRLPNPRPEKHRIEPCLRDRALGRFSRPFKGKWMNGVYVHVGCRWRSKALSAIATTVWRCEDPHTLPTSVRPTMNCWRWATNAKCSERLSKSRTRLAPRPFSFRQRSESDHQFPQLRGFAAARFPHGTGRVIESE